MRRFGTLSLILSIDSSSAMRGLAVSSTRSASARSLSPSMKTGFSACFTGSRPHRLPYRMPRKSGMLPVPIEVLLELWLVGFEIADDADDDRVALRDVEHPEVVFDPRARFDFDRAHRTQRHRELAIAIGIRGNRRDTWHARAAVWRALRPGRIDRDECACR